MSTMTKRLITSAVVTVSIIATSAPSLAQKYPIRQSQHQATMKAYAQQVSASSSTPAMASATILTECWIDLGYGHWTSCSNN